MVGGCLVIAVIDYVGWRRAPGEGHFCTSWSLGSDSCIPSEQCAVIIILYLIIIYNCVHLHCICVASMIFMHIMCIVMYIQVV